MIYVYAEDIKFTPSYYPDLRTEVHQCLSCYKMRKTYVLSARWEYLASDGKRNIDVELDICPPCLSSRVIYPRLRELIQDRANEVAIEASKNTGR